MLQIRTDSTTSYPIDFTESIHKLSGFLTTFAQVRVYSTHKVPE